MTTANKIRISWQSIFVLGFSILSLGFTSSVRAQSALGLSAIPPRLEVTINPGATVTKELKIRNESKTEKVITTTSKDFIVTDSEGTPTQLEDLDETSNRWAASSWVHLSPGSFKLRPGETKSIMITIIAPEDALPGGHYSTVLHTPKNEALLSETGSFIETNVGTLVYITIPGDIKEDARIIDFSAPGFSEHGPINFHTIIANLSDIHITPTGSISIKNWFGNKTADLPLSLTNIFPNTSREFSNTLDRRWLFGRYSATLSAGYGATGQALAATVFFWVIPWRLISLVIASLLLLIIILHLIRRHPSSPNQGTTTPVDELEKELEQLKKKYQDR